jgi:predicted SnoaL-like aldol condensation-catalyzing enzyme
MKVVFCKNYDYKRVEFCCGEMGDLVMNQYLQSYPHSDHYPIFYLQTYRVDRGEKMFEHTTVKYCPFCGAKIIGTYET